MTSQDELHAVVFDLDGLMFNTELLYEQVGGEVLKRRGIPLDMELLNAMMGRPAPVALQMMIDRHQLEDTVETLAAENDEIFEQILDEQLETMPGLLELLSALETAGKPKGIATSSRRSFAEDVLGRFDLRSRFEFLLTAEDVNHGKPHPEIYVTASERLGHLPDRVLEDSPIGCQAAVAAGAFAVAVPTPRTRELVYPGAQFVAESLEDPRIYEALAIDSP